MADEERKPRSVASINSPPTVERHAGRLGRLRAKLATTTDPERAASLQAEIDRRVAELTELRAAIDGAI